MKDSEKEKQNNMEKHNDKSMNEKILYEIKLVENDDGYRLEASGDKEVLKQLGIGPDMVSNLVNRKKRPAHLRRSRQWREMNRLQRQRKGARRRFDRINNRAVMPGTGQPESGPGPRAHKRFHKTRCSGNQGYRFNRRWGKYAPNAEGKGQEKIWNW